MVRLVNRAKMTTATTGTGTITLGAASGGFQTLAAAGVVDGDLVRYVIEEGTAFELGSGVFSSAGGTLTRNPSESSAGGGAITLAGSALVFVTAASTDIQQPPAEGPFVDGDKTKLNGIAAGAQVNVATNLSYTGAATTGTVASSTGTNATLPAATTSVAGLLTGADKTKLDGIAAGAQVNVATNLGQGGSGNSRTITSSTGSNVTVSTATTSNAGFMSTGDKTKLDGIAAGAQVNVATNLSYTGAATTGTVASSTGTNATLPAATTSVAGLLTGADKTKLDGIAAGAQVNVATNLSITNGTTAGPTINSSTGTNVAFPTASGTISGAVTTGTQTFAGTKTFSGAVILGQAGTATTQAVRADRNIATGTGILGGGNLTANRTFSIDTASQAEAQAGTDNAHVMTPLRVRNAFNATGSAPIFACRAWVNFNGTGTVAIRASGNVSSITDNGTGDFFVNFTVSMPDVNYSVCGSVEGIDLHPIRALGTSQFTAPETFRVRIVTGLTGGSGSAGRNEDCAQTHVAIFR